MEDVNGSNSSTAASSIVDFDIELDDAEFAADLPIVDKPPTLESILKEDEMMVEEEDDNISVPSTLQLFRDSADTSSLSSQDSLRSDWKRDRWRRGLHRVIHGSVLKPGKLKNISAQLLSAADRVDAGMPTALAVSSLIAIGTSHGLVLIFDPKQVLKWCLGSTAVGAQYGAVSALSFNRDCTRLLSGFAKGQITMWDLTNGKLIRTITDAHPPGAAILHIKFTDSPVLAVCSDSGGSVFELEFKRLIGVRTCESKCLFSGSRGEVCSIEPLHMNYTIKDHPMQDVMLLAMATLSKVLLVTLRPQLKVVFHYPLKGDASCLPLLAWQFVIIQVSERDRVIDPVLAFARESTIYFHQVICNSAQDIKCTGLQKLVFPHQLLSIAWMNPRTLIAVDTTEKMHVIDVRSEEELEVIDISEVQLIYNTSHFKSLATGGNVSQALAFAGERSCYQTVVSYSGQLFFLGTKTVYFYTLRTWSDRIDVLVRQEKYQDALALSLSFYEGKAKAVVGLVGSSNKKRSIVSNLMLDLLFQYVDLSMTSLCPEQGKIEALEEYYQSIVPVCVDYTLLLNRIDVLFGRIYDRFGEDMIAKGTFLECLEPYIVSDKLSSVPPSVMKDFVDHYQAKGMLESVEACIVHLEVASLDIHQVCSLDMMHGTAADMLLCVSNSVVSNLCSCLEMISEVLHKNIAILMCCGQTLNAWVFQCVTCLNKKTGSPGDQAYPHLRTLLQFDTREFLNVLALAFEEPEFNTEDGIQKRQTVVDILLQIMVESVGFTPTQIGILFTFLARQMARHDNTIMVNKVLFDQVLEFLSNPEDESRHEERQQALIELIHAGGLQQFDEERLLYLAEKAKFYRVCEILYEKRKQYDKILSCYLKDYSRKYHVFGYIDSILNSERYTDLQKISVQEEAIRNLQELVSIDCKQAAQMVISTLADSLKEVVKKLKSNQSVLFEFLQGVMSYKDIAGSAIHAERQVNIDPEIYELYVDLLCQFRQHDAYNFIKMNEGYRLEQTLEICRKHKASEATAYLLEKAGDIQGAFGIILESLQFKLKNFAEVLAGEITSNKDATLLFQEINAVLLVIVQLCQRSSRMMDEAEREKLWFPLMETMMKPQRKLKNLDDKQVLDDFKEATHYVLNSMMGYIALPAILQKIMQDPAYSTGKFGEVRELIMGMLETYNYEQTLMKTCKNLMNHDLHVHMKSLTSVAVRGFVPKEDNCSLCTKVFINQKDTNSIIIFRCGHSYHVECLRSVGSVHMIDGDETWVCYLCSHSKRGQLPSTRFHRALSNPSQTPYTRPDKTKGIQLDPQHKQALDVIRRSMKTPSRLAILTELSKPEKSAMSSRTGCSIFHNDTFQLRLRPPVPMDMDKK
ncbi:hypothetical protein ScPMuIL_017056 [Solemya velum]